MMMYITEWWTKAKRKQLCECAKERNLMKESPLVRVYGCVKNARFASLPNSWWAQRASTEKRKISSYNFLLLYIPVFSSSRLARAFFPFYSLIYEKTLKIMARFRVILIFALCCFSLASHSSQCFCVCWIFLLARSLARYSSCISWIFCSLSFCLPTNNSISSK